MLVRPVAGNAPQSVNPNEGQSAGTDRRERAKAIAAGQAPTDRGPAPDAQVERAQASIKRIKLRTQVSPDRHLKPEAATEGALEPAGAPAENDKLDPSEPAVAASEETKPLSPQFAALAKQKREIQLERQKLEADKAALATSQTTDLSGYVSKADLKANALKVLMENEVTYNQLTEEILASNDSAGELAALRNKVQALESGFENQTKSLTEREAAQERQVLAQIERNVNSLIAQGEDFEMIREAGYAPKVVELIKRVFKDKGEVLDETEAANLIEAELLEDSLKFARLGKVQSKLGATAAPKPTPVQQDRPGTKIMRTLTNRDGASSTTLSKRERAIAAMEGRLK